MKWGSFDSNERRLQALYDTLPTVECKGLCWEACGLIIATALEERKMLQMAGHGLSCSHELTCDYLTPERRCGVYAARPLICRLYGVSEGLLCPHGCIPTAVVPKSEVNGMIRLVRSLGGGLVTAEIRDET
jgi:Fe-S-cluster containining protein